MASIYGADATAAAMVAALGTAGVEGYRPQDIEDEFAMQSMPDRMDGEEVGRAELSKRALSFGVGFLDDCMRAILPHDLILLGADTGVGKTQLALSIAANNAAEGRRVAFFALEAEPLELERRMIFRRTTQLAGQAGEYGLTYVDWYLGRVSPQVHRLTEMAKAQVARSTATLRTYYRNRSFSVEDIRRLFTKKRNDADLIVLDHLHYIDSKDDNQIRAQRDAITAIRDTALDIGVPVICVAHLRKRGPNRSPVPDLEDFHGSSDIAKVATHAVMLSRAPRDVTDRASHAPTFMHVPKDRRSGATGLVARVVFDLSAYQYSNSYSLGRIVGDDWRPITEPPAWAKGAL